MPRTLAPVLFLVLSVAGTAAPCAESLSEICGPAASSEPAPSTLPADVRQAPYAQGLLWKVERPGHMPSYIYGTIHLDVPWLAQLPPRVNLLFAHSRTLVTEVTLGRDANELYRKRMLLPPGETLKPLLKPALFQRYLNLATGYYRLDRKTAVRLRPWAATNLLARPRPSTGVVLDDVLQQRARSIGKPVHALQTMGELIDDLESMPQRDQVAVLSDTICNHERLMRQVPKLVQIYRDEDLRALMALNEQGPHDDEALFQRMMQRMLYDRSALMVKRMQPYLERGGAFVAVGALHLPGRHGILALLHQRGYTVTRERR